MSSSIDPWWDYETVKHNTRSNTVDKLKHIIAAFNDHCGTNLSKTGKKQDLIDRIVYQLQSWRNVIAVEKWLKAKHIIAHVKSSGVPYPSSSSGSKMYADPGAVNGGTSQHLHSISNPPKVNGHLPAASAPGVGRYDPYATARKVSASGPSGSVAKPNILFKPSPFLRVEGAVSAITECPESTSPMDRRQSSVSFTLTADQQAKLNSPNSKYQLRLYCTSSTYHLPSSFRAGIDACPVEFPPTCEVRVNSTPLSANLKGLKKKPGTAPPADLGKAIKQPGPNRVEMVYVNSQQGTPPKKYFMVVMLVEVTSVDQLVERLKKGKFKGKEEIVHIMRANAPDDDDDIVAGPQRMSLKDPLTFVRVATASRSSQCVHPQCFDLATWFSVMEQTTTWLCPVCDKVLNPTELIVDGYFEDILKQTPDSVEDVMVEADGEWHTSDNKYASPGWKAAHPPPVPIAIPRSPTPKPIANGNGDAKGKARQTEILILDSDEEDEGRVKRELSPSWRNGLNAEASFDGTLPPQSQPPLSRTGSVIDLTEDSDDEEPTPVRAPAPALNPPTASRVLPVPYPHVSLPKRPEKRKGTDDYLPSPTEPVWKKSRAEADPRANGSANGRSTTSATASPIDRTLPSLALPYPTPHVARAPNGMPVPGNASSPNEDARFGYPSPPIHFTFTAGARLGSSYADAYGAGYPPRHGEPSSSRWTT